VDCCKLCSSTKNIISRQFAEEERQQKMSQERSQMMKLMKPWVDALSPVVFKYILQLIKEDLDAPPELRIFQDQIKAFQRLWKN
jgi:hypothetical protein